MTRASPYATSLPRPHAPSASGIAQSSSPVRASMLATSPPQHLVTVPETDVPAGGAFGILRQRDTGNSPSRARLASPLTTKDLTATLPSTPSTTPQFRFNPTPTRTASRGAVNMSLDTAMNGILHPTLQTNGHLIPALTVPPLPGDGATSNEYAPLIKETAPSSEPTYSPTSPVKKGTTSGTTRPAVTVVFDLDETLCNNRRPGKALLRPHAVETLQHLAALRNDPSVNCYVEVILWTASMECVARPVIDRLDPTGTIFTHHIYRDRRWYKEVGYTKDLRRLGRDMNLCVIVENSPASVSLNRRHSIIVRDFVSGQDHDLIAVKDVLDGWIRHVGKMALEEAGEKSSKWTPDMKSSATIVNYLHSHPAITPSNEICVKGHHLGPSATSLGPLASTSTRSPVTQPPTGIAGLNTKAIFAPRTTTLGTTMSRVAMNRPALPSYLSR